MIRHVWSVLCTKSSIDSQTNNVSLFEVIEQIELRFVGSSELPKGAPIDLELVTLWARENPSTPAEGEMRLRLLSPTGKDLAAFTAKIDLKKAGRNRHQARMHGILLDGSGWYEWEVSCRVGEGKWTRVASVPLEVQLVREATTPQEVAS
jgi:hypothetical protein